MSNIFGIVILNFLSELKPHLKGWQLTPYAEYVYPPDEYGYVSSRSLTGNIVNLHRPLRADPADFFLQHANKHAYILCKCAKSPLRLLSIDDSYHIYMYSANGIRSDKVRCGYSRNNHKFYAGYKPEVSQLITNLFLNLELPNISITPKIDISDQNSCPVLAEHVAKVLLKSFEHKKARHYRNSYGNIYAIVMSDKNRFINTNMQLVRKII